MFEPDSKYITSVTRYLVTEVKTFNGYQFETDLMTGHLCVSVNESVVYINPMLEGTSGLTWTEFNALGEYERDGVLPLTLTGVVKDDANTIIELSTSLLLTLTQKRLGSL